jgi:hypothetical protein
MVHPCAAATASSCVAGCPGTSNPEGVTSKNAVTRYGCLLRTRTASHQVYQLRRRRAPFTGTSSSGRGGLPFACSLEHLKHLLEILEDNDFDGFVEGLRQRFYAEDGRPGLPPGRYLRLLLIGYFEGLDAERAIARATMPCFF